MSNYSFDQLFKTNKSEASQKVLEDIAVVGAVTFLALFGEILSPSLLTS